MLQKVKWAPKTCNHAMIPPSGGGPGSDLVGWVWRRTRALRRGFDVVGAAVDDR